MMKTHLKKLPGSNNSRIVAALCAAFALAMGTPAQANVIHYEPFDYGATEGTIVGKGGSETGFTSSETWGNLVAITAATYMSAGMTFGSGATTLATSGGKLYRDSSSTQSRVARGIEIAAIGQIWGSYLWRPVSNRADFKNVAAVGITAASGNVAENNVANVFASEGLRFNNGGQGGVAVGNTSNSALDGTAFTVNTTYLVLYTVTGLGGASQTITQWILTADQFANFKAGGLTEAELNTTVLGVAADQVLQRVSLTAAKTSEIITSDYLALFQHQDISADYDEIRISGTSLDAASPVTTGPPVTYASWIAGYFGTESDPAIIGANADPDCDGVANGIKFLTGSVPDDPATHNAPSITRNCSGGMGVTFQRADAANIYDVFVQYGTDLQGWTSVPVPKTATAGPPVTVLENDTAPDDITGMVPGPPDLKMFARVAITLTP